MVFHYSMVAEFKLTLAALSRWMVDGGWERKRGGELRESMGRWEKKGKLMYTNANTNATTVIFV